jgi:hypothetical protein
VTVTASGAALSKSSGLSSGAKTGIGVGVALGVVAIVAGAAAFFFLRRRNKTKNTHEQKGSWYTGSNPQSPPGQHTYMQPLPSGGVYGEQKPDAFPPVRHELQAEPERRAVEMSPESVVRNPGMNQLP